MSHAATRLKHTCQYGQACAACAANPARVPLTSRIHATIRRALERTRRYRNQDHIESIKLPFKQPGADAYGPNGEQRFFTREAYKQAGRRNGMVWQ